MPTSLTLFQRHVYQPRLPRCTTNASQDGHLAPGTSKGHSDAPLPHGWYGYDATKNDKSGRQLTARDALGEAGASENIGSPDIKTAFSSLSSRGEEETKKRNPALYLDPRAAGPSKPVSRAAVNNEAYEYTEDGHVKIPSTPRDYPDAYPTAKTAKRFSDQGAAPKDDWFPSKRGSNTIEREVTEAAVEKRGPIETWHESFDRSTATLEKRVTEAIRTKFMVRAKDACSRDTFLCRKSEEARDMADVMAGRKVK